MKNNALIFATVMMIVGIYTFSGCAKKVETTDQTKPTVTLNGSANMNSVLNAAFTDPGATANDNKGNVLTVTTTVAPAFNKDLAGAYVYTYTTTDANGNIGEAKRTVNVVNNLIGMQGTYNATDDLDNNMSIDYYWTETIMASPTFNNRLVFSSFAHFPGCALMVKLAGGTTISGDPASQTILCGSGANMTNLTFSMISGYVADTIIIIEYHMVDNYGVPSDGTDTFVKQ
jgi:hypothetical protein